VLDLRRKPTQIEITVYPWDNKGRLAMPVLGRDFLHRAVSGKRGEHANSGRISGEELSRERINVVIRNRHTLSQLQLHIQRFRDWSWLIWGDLLESELAVQTDGIVHFSRDSIETHFPVAQLPGFVDDDFRERAPQAKSAP